MTRRKSALVEPATRSASKADLAEGLVVDAVELVGEGEPHRGRGQVRRLPRRAAGPHASEQLSEVHAPPPPRRVRGHPRWPSSRPAKLRRGRNRRGRTESRRRVPRRARTLPILITTGSHRPMEPRPPRGRSRPLATRTMVVCRALTTGRRVRAASLNRRVAPEWLGSAAMWCTPRCTAERVAWCATLTNQVFCRRWSSSRCSHGRRGIRNVT